VPEGLYVFVVLGGVGFVVALALGLAFAEATAITVQERPGTSVAR
jgi:hypothetical protein